MKIGEFAKLCGTKISVLRHYDREGLLEPQHIDEFSGYRYYTSEQILSFYRITALKKAGFLRQKGENGAFLQKKPRPFCKNPENGKGLALSAECEDCKHFSPVL